MQQGKARSNAKEQCKGAKGGQSSKGQTLELLTLLVTPIIKVTQYKGQRAKDRLNIYYNSLINNELDGGASET